MTNESAPPSPKLSHDLKVRHLTMMGLGSAIGAGLFVGTGTGINTAGPAVLVSYLIAGLIVIMVMRMLAEMASAMPSSGSFSTYAEIGIGRWAGFVMGWLYWFLLIGVISVEITASSRIIHGWLPSVPEWAISLGFIAIFAAINLTGVRKFGELEFWFAAIKVVAIIAFLVVGVLLVFGLLPDSEPVGLSVMLADGFAPMGWEGISAGLLIVVFAFGGIEIITIAAAESHDPRRSIAKAARSVVWRILVFYIGAILIMVLVLPWDSPELLQGPFVAVLNLANIPGAAMAMEVVVVIALLSSFNANIYATSRMAFSLSSRGDGHRALLRVSKKAVPAAAVWLSIVLAGIAVGLNVIFDNLLSILFNTVGATLLFVWILIVISQLRLRPRLEESGILSLRMWGFPYLSWLTLIVLGAVTVLMLFDDSARPQIISTAIVAVVLGVIYYFGPRRNARETAQIYSVDS